MHRGEIWYVNLDPTIGSEIKKKRPCVIINNDLVGRLPNKVIIPITEWNDRYAKADWMVRIDPDPYNGLDKTSAADAFQIRSVSELRLVHKAGILRKDKLDEIVAAVTTVISEI
jgi:mRNA interferase MazF